MSILTVILLMLVSTIIGAFGSIFLKKGAEHFHIRFTIEGIVGILKNWKIILGLGLYVLSTITFIYMLKTEELSVLYPLTSMGYIFVTVFSVVLLKEKLNIYKIFGIALIVLGVALVTF
ncbi:MAG: EamA family transporter [Candidatus Woesearchaeota archaeon]